MKFSVIIPSFLGFYANAARDRDKKILRAIASVQNQSFTDYEIIVVADGCQQTMDLVKEVDLRSFFIERGKLFGGAPRNKGIEEARGEYIVYLDVDDLYGNDHLRIINDNLDGYDWVWFNDIRYNPRKDIWLENLCDIRTRSKHGTSNVCHKKNLGVTWDAKGYAHDYFFVQSLLRFHNNAKITTPEYYVCHIPGTRNSGGYDL